MILNLCMNYTRYRAWPYTHCMICTIRPALNAGLILHILAELNVTKSDERDEETMPTAALSM